MSKNNLTIVKTEDIPKPNEVINTPKNNLVKLYKTCKDMERLCVDLNGVGLAAVQVGIPWKLFVAILGKSKIEYFIDCSYDGIGERSLLSVEGCLSLRGKDGNLLKYQVKRFQEIRFFGKKMDTFGSPTLKDFDVKLTGLPAIVAQHEIDHGLGILISDIGEPIYLWQGA